MDFTGSRENGDLIDLGEPPPGSSSQLARLGDEVDLLDAILGGMLEYASGNANQSNGNDDLPIIYNEDYDEHDSNSLLQLVSPSPTPVSDIYNKDNSPSCDNQQLASFNYLINNNNSSGDNNDSISLLLPCTSNSGCFSSQPSSSSLQSSLCHNITDDQRPLQDITIKYVR